MDNGDTWQQVLQIISTYDTPFIIVSATARTTRKLISAAKTARSDRQAAAEIVTQIGNRHHQLIDNFLQATNNSAPGIKSQSQQWIETQIGQLNAYLDEVRKNQELTPGLSDAVASTGERLSSRLLALCGKAIGLSTTWIDAGEIIQTDSTFGQANPNLDYINKQAGELQKVLDNGKIPIMGGYYGQDESGSTTTLGFEGSDYSASLIGSALSADAIEIWTDVSGIYTCDPRLVEEAQPISKLSFREATELAYFGAKVLHPSTTKPASVNNIPMRVKNIFAPNDTGTLISAGSSSHQDVKAITGKKDCSIITVTSSQTVMGYEFLAGVFETLRWHHLAVDVVTTSEASVSIAIKNGGDQRKAVKQLQDYGTVEVTSRQGIISLVGCHTNIKQLLDEVLAELDTDTVQLISYSKSKGNLNVVTDQEHTDPTIKAIHGRLFN